MTVDAVGSLEEKKIITVNFYLVKEKYSFSG
jgi:hypothetical protein